MWLLYPFAIPLYSAKFRFRVVFRSECLPVVQGSGLCLLVSTPVYTGTSGFGAFQIFPRPSGTQKQMSILLSRLFGGRLRLD